MRLGRCVERWRQSTRWSCMQSHVHTLPAHTAHAHKQAYRRTHMHIHMPLHACKHVHTLTRTPARAHAHTPCTHPLHTPPAHTPSPTLRACRRSPMAQGTFSDILEMFEILEILIPVSTSVVEIENVTRHTFCWPNCGQSAAASICSHCTVS